MNEAQYLKTLLREEIAGNIALEDEIATIKEGYQYERNKQDKLIEKLRTEINAQRETINQMQIAYSEVEQQLIETKNRLRELETGYNGSQQIFNVKN